MLRRAFVRRMIFAGLATWFLDLPLPREASAEGLSTYPAGLQPGDGWQVQYRPVDDAWPGEWIDHGPVRTDSPISLTLDGLANDTHYEIRIVHAA